MDLPQLDGSSALYVKLGKSDNTKPKPIEFGTTIHLALDEFKLIDLSFSLTITPMHLKSNSNSSVILSQPQSESLNGVTSKIIAVS